MMLTILKYHLLEGRDFGLFISYNQHQEEYLTPHTHSVSCDAKPFTCLGTLDILSE